MKTSDHQWPEIHFQEIKDTLKTLHQWIQIVGKVRLKTMPWQNHSWHSTLYITPNGFSTHGIPYNGTTFQIDFDFKRHQLLIQCAHAEVKSIPLESKSVATFYQEVFDALAEIKIHVKIHPKPNEIEPAIPFYENVETSPYNPKSAETIWEGMSRANEVFNQFRSEFIGKASPVHLFWGAFDLAVSRFSGNPAPDHPGGMPNMPLDVMQEAYSQEVSSAGFWLGSEEFPTAVFYAYAYPSEADFSKQQVKPEEAFFSNDLGEFLLKYEDVIDSPHPEKKLHDFLQSTYDAAVITSKWDRNKLEKK